MYCEGCKKFHSSRSWIFKKGSWYCTKYHKPTSIEFVPGRIKDSRKEYFNSIVQPYRQGELSKEYIEAHGTKGIDPTPEEIMKAKDVWKDLEGYKTRKHSK